MSDPSFDPNEPASLAERLYFEALSAAGGGRTVDLDALCRARADLAGQLRLVHELWQQLKDSARAPLGERLRRRFGPEADPGVSLQGTPEPAAEFSSAMIQRLSGRRDAFARYQLEGEIARGGMGAILSVWDGDLRRHLAMKVALATSEGPVGGEPPRVPVSGLARFLEEAQITGQLDHPGIVPVHELGLDADGRVYFTMKLVKGQTLGEVFDELARGAGGWTETRVLGLLLKVCEAIGYAHDKGVIHRDLKPANVMVGKFGEVYVMDWGVAKVLGREDTRDLRVRPPVERAGERAAEHLAERPESEPRGAAGDRTTRTPDSPLMTMEGEVVGTPAYMSPEQARGQVSEMGPASDVYSVGAMLYHLLAGHMPYVPPGVAANSYSVWRAVQEGPPRSLHEVASRAPVELVAICERAMAREKSARYANTSELALDLAAYVEGRVVRAHEVGAWAEARKWIRRNRALAAALAGGVLLLAAGLSVSLVFKARADENAALAAQRADETAKQAELALANADLAREQERLAAQRADDVLSLSAIQSLEELIRRADALWPAHPENLPRYEEWLAEARALLEGRAADPARGWRRRPSLEQHRAMLDGIRERGRPAASGMGAHEFDDPEDRWWHAQLAELVADLEAFRDPATGGLFSAGISEAHGWGIARRAEFARTIGDRSVAGPEARRLWEEAAAAIARSPYYGGLALSPQMGLLPIGADPESGLWEFAELQTGEPAVRGPDGQLILEEETGLVFVLLPGGTFTMGAQRTDPKGPNYDSAATPDEGPPHAVELSAFFLSKYEMTQGQWLGFVGWNPSQYGPHEYSVDWNSTGRMADLVHPVERVSWDDCDGVLGRLGLELPSEAQWEYGARGGTTTIWWTGDEMSALSEAGNVADAYAKRHGGGSWPGNEPDLDDGNTVHARVGSYAANAFGLHDVIGNPWEWCQDGYQGDFYRRSQGSRDPVSDPEASSERVNRGGSFNDAASLARSAYRSLNSPSSAVFTLGVRPARRIMP